MSRQPLSGWELERELADMDWEDVEAGADHLMRLIAGQPDPEEAESEERPAKNREVLEVRAKCCEHCLYSANRLVSQQEADRHIEQAVISGKYFMCHESEFFDRDLCCRRFYDTEETLVTSLADQLGLVRFINVERQGNEFTLTDQEQNDGVADKTASPA